MIQIVHPDGRILYLDSTMSMSVTEGASPALHPIEGGANAVDHVEVTSTTLSISALITENPSQFQQDHRADHEGFISVSEYWDVLSYLEGPSRLEAALAFLRDCVGEFVDVISGRFWYSDCLLTAWPHEWSIKQAHPISLSFTLARRVNVSLVDVPPSKAAPPSSQKKKDKGEGGTEDAPDKSILTEGAEAGQALIDAGAEALKGYLG